MRKIAYKVYDTTGSMLRIFNTLKEARAFRALRGRYDWLIKQITVQ